MAVILANWMMSSMTFGVLGTYLVWRAKEQGELGTTRQRLKNFALWAPPILVSQAFYLTMVLGH
jgi:hypothetical protein